LEGGDESFFHFILFKKNYVDDLRALICNIMVEGFVVFGLYFLGIDFWNYDLFYYGVETLTYFIWS